MAQNFQDALKAYAQRRREEEKESSFEEALEAYTKVRQPGASYLTPPTTNTGAAKAYWVQQAADAPAPGARSRDALRAANTALQETPGLVLGSLMNFGSMVRDQVLPAVLMPTVPSSMRDKILPPVEPAKREGSVMLRGAQAGIEKARGQMETPVLGPTLLDFTTEAVRMGGSGALSAATGVPFSLMAGAESGGRAADEAAQAGKSMDTQLLYGAASGLVSAGVESLAGLGASKALNSTAGAALRKAAPKAYAWLERAGGSAAGRALLSGVGEGFEEVVQYPLDKALERVILDDRSPYDVKEQAYSALMGFVLGGLLGAPGAVAESQYARAVGSAAARTANALTADVYESLGIDAPAALDPKNATETQIKARMQETYRVIRAQAEVERQQRDEGLRANGLNPEIARLAETLPVPQTEMPTAPAIDPRMRDMMPAASIASGLVPNERSAQLPSTTASVLDWVGKNIGVRITIGAPTGEMGANGWYGNGNLVIASDAQNPLLVVLKHEVTHRLQEAAPGEYGAFRDYASHQMALRGYGGDEDRAVQDYQQRYAQKGYNLTVDGAMDEMAADYTEYLMENPGEFERVVLDNRTVARRIYDAVRQVVANIRAAFTGTARDRAALEQTGRSYKQLQEGLRLWETALRAAEDVTRTAEDLRAQGAEVRTAQNAGGMEPAAQFSERREIAHIKEQIRDAQDRLNAMGIVAKKDGISRKGKTAAQFENEMKEQLAGISSKIDVLGLGIVEFGKSEIETGLSYAHTNAEIASILLVPSVLKRGADISGHEDHKSRGFSTKTIAAPVEINKQRGNMAVVLTQTGKNRYKAHRILAPDGNVFVLPEVGGETEQAPRTHSGTEPATRTGTVSDSGRLAANSTVPQEEQTVKGNLPETDRRYSLKDDGSLQKEALDYFGATQNWKVTGFITPDGDQLDLSGRKHGNSVPTERVEDHREVSQIYPQNVSNEDALVDFMAHGNIRLMPENGGINLSVPPTRAQEGKLRTFIDANRGYVILDIDDTSGRTVSGTEYPEGTTARKILADIRNYFADGTLPSVPESARYQYSLKDDGAPIDVSGADAAAQNKAHTPKELRVMREYENAVDLDIVDFIDEVWAAPKERRNQSELNLGGVTPALQGAIGKILGIDASKYIVKMRGDVIAHIEKGHGKGGTRDNSMSDVRDIARIEYVLQDFDDAHYVGTSREITNRDGSRAPIIQVYKKVDGYYYVATVVPDSKSRAIYIKSAYKNRNLISSGWMPPPTKTSENALTQVPNSTIPRANSPVKENLPPAPPDAKATAVSADVNAAAEIPNLLAGMKTMDEQMRDMLNGVIPADVDRELTDMRRDSTDARTDRRPNAQTEKDADTAKARRLATETERQRREELGRTKREEIRLRTARTVLDDTGAALELDDLTESIGRLYEAMREDEENGDLELAAMAAHIAAAADMPDLADVVAEDIAQKLKQGFYDTTVAALEELESQAEGQVQAYAEAADATAARRQAAETRREEWKKKETEAQEEIGKNLPMEKMTPAAVLIKRLQESGIDTEEASAMMAEIPTDDTAMAVGKMIQDKKALAGLTYNNSSIERVFDINSKDSPEARELQRDAIERPFRAGAARYVAAMNKAYKELADKMEELGIKRGSKESAAVQHLAEGMKQNAYTEAEKQAAQERRAQIVEAIGIAYDVKEAKLKEAKGAPTPEQRKAEKDAAYAQYYQETTELQKERDELELIIKGFKRYTMEDLRREFPGRDKAGRASYEKIVEAERWFRAKYDAYINLLNEALEAIYPSYEQKARERLLSAEATMKGHLQRLNEIRAKRSSLEAQIDKRVNQKKKWRNPEKYRTYEINTQKLRDQWMATFRAEQEQIPMFEKAEKTYRALKRAYDSKDYLVGKRMMPRKAYVHHFQEMASGSIQSILRSFGTKAEIDPRLVDVSAHTKPYSKFTGFLQRREGNEYTADIVTGFMNYIEAAEYKLHIETMLPKLRAWVRDIAEATEKEKNANATIQWMTDWINDLAGKTNRLDRNIQSDLGRNIMRGIEGLNNRAKANAILLNLNSIFAQFSSTKNAVALIKNPIDFLKGIRDYARSATDRAMRDRMAKSPFLMERYDLPATRARLDPNGLKKAATWGLGLFDEVVTRTTWNAAYAEAERVGAKAPIEYADRITRRAVAGRGVGDIPLSQKSRIMKLVAPFNIEPLNDWNLMKDFFKQTGIGIKERDKEAFISGLTSLMKLFFVAWLQNNLLEWITGRRAVFDPIHAIASTLRAPDEGKEDTRTWLQVIGQAAGKILGNLVSTAPYGQQLATVVTSTLPDSTVKNMFGGDDPTRYGVGIMGTSPILGVAASGLSAAVTGETGQLKKNVGDLLATLGPPMGGRQIQRTAEMLQATQMIPNLLEGMQPVSGSYSATGDLQFPIRKDIGNLLTGMAFGKYATREGREYIRGGGLPLSDTSTKKVETASRLVPTQDAYDLSYLLRGLDKKQDKVDVLLAAAPDDPITGLRLADVFTGSGKGDWPRDLTERAAAALVDIAGPGDDTSVLNWTPSDTVSHLGQEYELTDAERDAWEASVRAAAAKEINRLVDSDTWKKASAQDQSKQIRGALADAKEAAKQDLIEGRGERWFAEKVDKERFDALSQTVPDGEAYDIVSGLRALEPEEGKKSVSARQRYEVLMSSDLSDEEKAQAFVDIFDEDALLAEIQGNAAMIRLFNETGETGYISVAVPETFSEDKVEYVLSDEERQLYRQTWLETFNRLPLPATSNVRVLQARVDKALTNAREKAKAAVMRRRRQRGEVTRKAPSARLG
jgi:hypothetical protein